MKTRAQDGPIAQIQALIKFIENTVQERMIVQADLILLIT